MKAIYYFTMIVLFICIVSNAYCLLVLHHSLPFLKVGNIITPIVVLFYLAAIVVRRRKNQKRKNEHVNRIFSKN